MSISTLNDQIGFIQGRLSPMVEQKIQAFPWNNWEEEFSTAYQNQFKLMEWTLDDDKLEENPLLTTKGQEKIKELCIKNKIQIPSLTCDFFMQAPFFKFDPEKNQFLLKKFVTVCEAASRVGIRYLVVPLVDFSSLKNETEENAVLEGFLSILPKLKELKLQVVFESDYEPLRLKKWIDQYPKDIFGINYDIGNSASLGFQFEDELNAYFDRILNVHVKDRLLHGTTVPLGTGNAKLPETIQLLVKNGYQGNWILQTARSPAGQDVQALVQYRKMTQEWICS